RMDRFFKGTVTPTMGPAPAAAPFNPPPAAVLPGNPGTLEVPFELPSDPLPRELLESKMLPEFTPPEFIPPEFIPPAPIPPEPLFIDIPDDAPLSLPPESSSTLSSAEVSCP